MGRGIESQADRESRVLLHVATRKDAEVSGRLLASAGIPTRVCGTAEELAREIRAGAAAVLATEELVQAGSAGQVIAALDDQPAWSDLPVILLMRGGTEAGPAIEALRRMTNVVILERPTSVNSVLSAVKAAVRARARQYETRAHIDTIKEAEAKARAADQAKNDFLAALSHELRTPLTPVLLVASEAASDPGRSASDREIFELIVKNVGLEARLIDDLLDMTRITHGKLKLEPSPANVIGILRDAIETVRPEIRQKELRLVEDILTGPAMVMGDAIRLQQVFWNVLRNAVKFTPPGGAIAVRAVQKSSTLEIAVSDSGIGMSPDEIASAFEAFVQGNHARGEGAHRFGGLGLGLAISRSLIELHAGEIRASSEGRGKGCTFTISLPLLAATPAAGPSAEVVRRTVSRPLRILLVEDHPASRDALNRMLVSRGHTVTSAGDLAEARKHASRLDFDLLLTDIGLPDGTGYELLGDLRLTGDWMAVALTGYGMDDDVARSKEAGFFAHLTKPIRSTDLDGMLNLVIEELETRSRR